MKNKIHIYLTIIFSLVLGLVLVGCNLAETPTAERPPQDLVYTIAAQTVIAQYTQAAVETNVTIEDTRISTQTPLPTVEPTATLEPTPTQEPTSTLTPTETPTRTTIPHTIFEDDFSNESLWYVFDSDEYSFEYRDGRYRIYNNILNGAIWSVRRLEFRDIRIEVDASREGGPEDGYFGVICRFRNEGDDYYSLVIGGNGAFGILKMEDGELDFLESGVDEDNVIKRGLGEINRIRGVCSGDLLSLYVNDELLLEVYDDTFSKGDVGILTGNRLSGVGIEVFYDNFAIVMP